MSAEAFLDTNILVYSFDRESPEKAAKAREIISGTKWQVSWQVIQEFANVAKQRFKSPIKTDDLESYLRLVLWPKCSIYPSQSLFSQALRVQQEAQYRFYDSLVVASALTSGAAILYSEDLQHGRKIGSLEIVNPFL